MSGYAHVGNGSKAVLMAAKRVFRYTLNQTQRRRRAMSEKCLNSEVAVSFEYLVGASEQRWRHSEPKCIGGSQIDGEFELGGLFNGKF